MFCQDELRAREMCLNLQQPSDTEQPFPDHSSTKPSWSLNTLYNRKVTAATKSAEPSGWYWKWGNWLQEYLVKPILCTFAVPEHYPLLYYLGGQWFLPSFWPGMSGVIRFTLSRQFQPPGDLKTSLSLFHYGVSSLAVYLWNSLSPR